MPPQPFGTDALRRITASLVVNAPQRVRFPPRSLCCLQRISVAASIEMSAEPTRNNSKKAFFFFFENTSEVGPVSVKDKKWKDKAEPKQPVKTSLSMPQ